MTITHLPRLFTVPEAAKRVGLSENTFRREIREGRITARRIGRCVRVLDEELARWLRAGSDVAMSPRGMRVAPHSTTSGTSEGPAPVREPDLPSQREGA